MENQKQFQFTPGSMIVWIILGSATLGILLLLRNFEFVIPKLELMAFPIVACCILEVSVLSQDWFGEFGRSSKNDGSKSLAGRFISCEDAIGNAVSA